jgi:TonB family protein
MKKYGCDWTSEKAADAYKLILIEIGCHHGGFRGTEDLIDLADEVLRLEGRIPDGFEVAVDLGSIYSAAAVSNARDARMSDELIAKAHDAWRIASSHFGKDLPREAALGEFGALRAAYVGAYWQIACEIGFARYIQAGRTDVTRLRGLKEFWERARQENPDHPVLQLIGEEIDRKLDPAEQPDPMQEQPSAFLHETEHEQSGLEPPRQRRRALMAGTVVAVTIALSAGLAYVYRNMDGYEASQQRSTAASDPGGSVPSEHNLAAPLHQRQPIALSAPEDKAPAIVSSRGAPAEAVLASREPVQQSQQHGQSLRKLERQIRARAKAFLAPPRGVPPSAQAVYSVTVTSSGKVEKLTLTKSSGHAGFDEAVREALLAAQPYPRVGELLGNGSSQPAIVAMKAERRAKATRKTQRSVSRTASAFSKQPLDEMHSDTDSSKEAFQESSPPLASSPISPPSATSPRKVDECALGVAGIICRERMRWKRCSGRWGTPGCEVHQRETGVTD